MPQYEYTKDLTLDMFKEIFMTKKGSINLMRTKKGLIFSKLTKDKNQIKRDIQTIFKELQTAVQLYHTTAKGQRGLLPIRVRQLQNVEKGANVMIGLYQDMMAHLTEKELQERVTELVKIEQGVSNSVRLSVIARNKWLDLEYLLEFIKPGKRRERQQKIMGPMVTSSGQHLLRVGGPDILEILSRTRLVGENAKSVNIMAKNFEKWVNHKRECRENGKDYELFPVWLENQDNWYKGEDFKIEGVNFFSDKEKKYTMVEFDKDGLMTEIGLQNENALEFHNMDTGGKPWAFVIDPQKNIYSYEHIGGLQHHSAALSGGACLCAGKVKVEDGVLKEITSETGHYKTNMPFFIQGLRIFKENNAFKHGPCVVFNDGAYEIKFNTVDQLLNCYGYIQNKLKNQPMKKITKEERKADLNKFNANIRNLMPLGPPNPNDDAHSAYERLSETFKDLSAGGSYDTYRDKAKAKAKYIFSDLSDE